MYPYYLQAKFSHAKFSRILFDCRKCKNSPLYGLVWWLHQSKNLHTISNILHSATYALVLQYMKHQACAESMMCYWATSWVHWPQNCVGSSFKCHVCDTTVVFVCKYAIVVANYFIVIACRIPYFCMFCAPVFSPLMVHTFSMHLHVHYSRECSHTYKHSPQYNTAKFAQ